LLRNNFLWKRLRGFRNAAPPKLAAHTPRTLVVLMDGTMSSLRRGDETNIGLTYRLLSQPGAVRDVALHYEPGIQWRGLRHANEVIAGVGINHQIKRGYSFLAENYRAGDKVILMGYSRGAYAVRSLAGLIDQMGLLRAQELDSKTLDRIYRHYRTDPLSETAQALKASLCHDSVQIDFLGVYDTVRALGIRWPGISRFLPVPHPYHNHKLGPCTRVGRQALAINEGRNLYQPVIWETGPDTPNDVIQMWFRGRHGDIGGQLSGFRDARPLSNIPLVWILSEAEKHGLSLPHLWETRFVTSESAPSTGRFHGYAKYFLIRRRRVIGADPSERIHKSAENAALEADVELPLHA